MAESRKVRAYRRAAHAKRRPALRVQPAAPQEPPIQAAPATPPTPLPVPTLTTPRAVPGVRAAYLGAPTTPDPPTPIKVQSAIRNPKSAILKWGLALLGLIVFGYGAWLVVAVVQFQSAVYKPLPPTPTASSSDVGATATAAANVEEGASPTPDVFLHLPAGRVNVLVLGTDKRPDDPDHYPRSDTLILANVDTVSRTVRLMTIPRDLIMDVPGYGKNKVNAAYLFGEYYQEPGGGQALAVRTVSAFFDVPIDHYVTVNFEGFKKLVDTVGGIYVNVPYEMDDYEYPTDDEGDPFGTMHVHFDEGWQYMDGKESLRYARTRHADNDFMRSKRQLQVIMAVRDRAMSLDLIPRLPTLIEQLGGMIETNIAFDRQLAFAQLGYSIEPSDIVTMTIDAEMILPATLPDGSEGLKLDWKKAQPMLDEFFGVGYAQGGATATPSRGASGNEDEASEGSDVDSDANRLLNDTRPSRSPTSQHPNRQDK